MEEHITFTITEQGLHLLFETMEKKNQFLEDMEKKGINFFHNSAGEGCYIKPYAGENSYGFFISKEGRLGLNFPSKELKFFFKERTGIDSGCFMDMGAGYDDTQMHFKETSLFPELGLSMKATRIINAFSPAPK